METELRNNAFNEPRPYACWSCGANISAEDNYCRKCGKGQGRFVDWYYKHWGLVLLALGFGDRAGGLTGFTLPHGYTARGNYNRWTPYSLVVEEGKAVLWRIIEGADVFIEGFRPGVIQRLGFDYEAVAAREPRILYLSISGFGQHGTLVGRPAMDPREIFAAIC